MERKSFLLLTETVLMIAVFAFAAALCLRGVNLAGDLAEENRIRDRAVRTACNAAEVLSSCGGSMEYAASRLGGTAAGDTWTVSYDENWNSVEVGGVYELRAVKTAGETPLLGMAEITVAQGEEILYTITAAWQIPGEEVSP